MQSTDEIMTQAIGGVGGAPCPSAGSATATAIAPSARSAPSLWNFRRCALAGTGVCFVVLGAIGIMVPGIPGAVFLLLASWCFAKSFPSLERKLLRNRFFAPYMRFVDGDEALPRRDKIAAIIVMWISTCISIAILWWQEVVPPYVLPVIALAACVGTVVIMRRGGKRSVAGT